MSKYKAIFFDFDGVLCFDRFYESTCREKYPQVIRFVNEIIFGGEQKYADRWMRGEFSYHDINKMMAENVGLDIDMLDSLLVQSVKDMKLDKRMMEFVNKVRKTTVPIALVTNNMDTFGEIILPEKRLNDVFPVIVSSYDYGCMKHDDNGRLFDLALAKLSLDTFEDVLLIDDSKKACDMFESKGGKVHRFVDYDTLIEWFEFI